MIEKYIHTSSERERAGHPDVTFWWIECHRAFFSCFSALVANERVLVFSWHIFSSKRRRVIAHWSDFIQLVRLICTTKEIVNIFNLFLTFQKISYRFQRKSNKLNDSRLGWSTLYQQKRWQVDTIDFALNNICNMFQLNGFLFVFAQINAFVLFFFHMTHKNQSIATVLRNNKIN